MIYSANNITPINEELIDLNRIIGTTRYVKKDDCPEEFKKLALRICDIAEKHAKKITSGPDTSNNYFGSYFAKSSNKIKNKPVARKYVIHVFNGSALTFFGINTPQKYNELAETIMKQSGLTKGKKFKKATAGGYYYFKNAKTKSGEPCTFLCWPTTFGDAGFAATLSMAINLYCVETEWSKKYLESGNLSSLDEEFFDPTEESTVAHGLEKVATTPEELYGTELWSVQDSDKPDDAFGGSQDIPSPKYEGYINPKVRAAFTELLDMTNRSNRRGILALNEEQSNTVLTALTSKLYDYIVSKVDEIDYGEIPDTKGDVTKLSNYDKLRDCIVVLKDILKEYRQDTTPIDDISEALANLETRKDLFLRAFKTNVEVPIIVYNNTVLAVLESVSYMIATSIEFIKTPNTESFSLVLDKVGYAKTKNCMLYNTLKKFNRSCKSGEMDKALNYVIDHKMKGYQEGAVGVVAAVTTGVLAILMIIPIIREMVFLFYYIRMRVSEFFDMQADLLQMNAHNVEQNKEIDKYERDKIINKQMSIVKRFKEISNKIAFTVKKAEMNTSKEIENSTKTMNLKDVSSSVPNEVSALF